MVRRCLCVALVGGIMFMAGAQTQVHVRIGPFLLERGDKLALEIVRDDPCPCACDPITVERFLVLDAEGRTIYEDSTRPYPVPREDWWGQWDLTTSDGDPVLVGKYTAVVVTSLGDFQAELVLAEPGGRASTDRATAEAAVCGISLALYRLLGNGDDTSPVTLRTGQCLMIALPGNPSTGYVWEIEGEPAFLTRIEGAAYRSEAGLIGSGGTFFFRYEATAEGAGEFSLAYRRPWETVPPERTFAVLLVVR